MVGGVAAGAVDAFGVVVERCRRRRRRPAPARCRRARRRNRPRVVTALPARSQSAGVLNSPPIIITVGSRGGGSLANHAGGRYTSSPRCLKFDAASPVSTCTTVPLAGILLLLLHRGDGAPDRSDRAAVRRSAGSMRSEPSGSSRPTGSAPARRTADTAAPPRTDTPAPPPAGPAPARRQHRRGHPGQCDPDPQRMRRRVVCQSLPRRRTSTRTPPGRRPRTPPTAATPTATGVSASRSPQSARRGDDLHRDRNPAVHQRKVMAQRFGQCHGNIVVRNPWG